VSTVKVERKALAEAGQKAGGGVGPAIGQDFEIDEAGGAVDGDIGIRTAAIERRQVFDAGI
jgi:hypothetical protein